VSKGIGNMVRTLNAAALIPTGLIMDSLSGAGVVTKITVRSATGSGACPDCGVAAGCLNSRYTRMLSGLPLDGRVRAKLLARRFRCDRTLCARRIFSEQLVAPLVRRTARLDELVHHLGITLGSRPTDSFA
jgi:hypothetical protein